MGFFNFFKKKQTEVREFVASRLTPWNHDLMVQCIKTNDDIRKSGAKLRDISREMAKNDSNYRKYLGMCERNIVGSNGIQLQMDVRLINGKSDNFANREIEKRWACFSKTGGCTADRKLSLRLLDCLIVRTQRVDGEVFLRRIPGFKNKSRFAFQLLDSAACPHDLNFLTRTGNRVRMGIEFDSWDCPVAYYFYTGRRDAYDTWAPYESVMAEHPDSRYIRIPAEEINHIFFREFPGQIRGFPFGQSAIQDMNILSSYFNTELIAASAASRKLGKLVNKKGVSNYGGRNSAAQEPQRVTQEAGSIDILNGDWDLLQYTPQHPAGNFPPFVTAEKRNIANGLDVAYNTFANDLEGVNFSSIRAGLLDERDMWMSWQEFFCETYKSIEFEKWLEMQFLQPDFPFSVPAFERLNHPLFLCRRWPWVDPVNDAQSNILQMAMGATCPQDIAANLGNKFEDNIEMLADAAGKLGPVADLIRAIAAVNTHFSNTNPQQIQGDQNDEQN